MPSRTTMAISTALVCFGAFQLMLAVFVFLPMIVFAPQKFALSFTGGSTCVFIAGIMFRGWKTQMKQMVSKERLPFTGGMCWYELSIYIQFHTRMIYMYIINGTTRNEYTNININYYLLLFLWLSWYRGIDGLTREEAENVSMDKQCSNLINSSLFDLSWCA